MGFLATTLRYFPRASQSSSTPATPTKFPERSRIGCATVTTSSFEPPWWKKGSVTCVEYAWAFFRAPQYHSLQGWSSR